MVKHTFKIWRCERSKIFEVCLAIFQLYQGVIGYRFWAHENLLPNLELAKNKISIKLEMINTI